MSVITVDRQFGSRGSEVGAEVARRLGYQLMDDELRRHVRERIEDAHHHQAWDESLPGPWTRLFLILASAGAEIPTSQDDRELGPAAAAVRVMQRMITEAAQRGRVVIVGRAAGHLLAGREDIFRVMLWAPDEFRAEELSRGLGLGPDRARRELRSIDRRQTDFVRRVYGRRWGHFADYDLVLNTAMIGVDGASGQICEAVNLRRRAAARMA